MTAPLHDLLSRVQHDPALHDVLSTSAQDADGLVVPDAARPLVLAALAHAVEGCVLVVAPGDAEAEALADAVRELTPDVGALPAWDVLPYEGLSPDARISARRIEALHLLAHRTGPRVVVASVRGFVQKPAPGVAGLTPLEIARGSTIDRDELLARLVELGYTREDIAEEPGTFAVRGGIVDVYPASLTRTVRVELFGDDVESLRWVDPDTQRSLEPVDRVEVFARAELAPSAEVRRRAEAAVPRVRELPFSDELVDRLARLGSGALPDGAESVLPTIWDPATDALQVVAPPGTVVVVLEPKRVQDEADRAAEEEEQLTALWTDPDQLGGRIQDRTPERWRDEARLLYQPLAAVLDGLRAAGRSVVRWSAFGADDDAPAVDVHAWGTGLSPTKLLERCRDLRAQGMHLVFCAHEPEAPAVGTRLTEEGLADATVVVSHLRGGFVAPSMGVAVITHTEWHARPPSSIRPSRRTKPRALTELVPGDLVVHVLHGIGRYTGMTTREVSGFTREYLLVEYASGDRLFVPSDTTESLSRYLGSEEPKLSRLGTTEWERTKARVRKKVRDIAADLIRIYSARLHAEGHAYPVDTPWQRELAESFPYEETPDQLAAIEDVMADMARPKPMDRLVCGDVGYGKTEIAVRAAFTAVTEGRQCAVLVPTTLLAQQHSVTFADRLGPLGANVAVISRFLSPAEQDKVLRDVAAGKVDVVIGTHRLLGKDVTFADLGLLIVDEEHRFGVAQKEQLKRLRVEMDVLTLTATPIPRTLEMSMSGVRDLSVIETAPAARRPIRTFVGPFDERVIVAAVRRELARSGQIFIVHNRVQTIDRERRRLERLVPEARIGVGHGQMREDELERTMLDFWARDLDVMLCTTIIEAGLDIPTVNTLIVDHADKLGLAQLYQLRGRVGRAGEQAYAYLFYPDNIRLTETAHERLKTLARHTELGAGMAIALKDLEIRGAGNLLGAEQHGHIEAVGFEMYVKLLEEATRELQGERVEVPVEVRIDLPIDAYLPAEYIDREPLRLAAYRRIAETVTVQDVQDAGDELTDRFGPPPAAASALLEVASLRAVLRSLGIHEVGVAPHELHGRVARLKPVEMAGEWMRVRLKRLHPRSVLSDATHTLILPVPEIEGVELVDWLRDRLLELFERDIVPA